MVNACLPDHDVLGTEHGTLLAKMHFFAFSPIADIRPFVIGHKEKALKAQSFCLLTRLSTGADL
jgi:hypothetical protein